MADDCNRIAKMNSLLNRKRKADSGEHAVSQNMPSSSRTAEEGRASKLEELKLKEERRKAAEAILRESKRAKERADLLGPQGWLRPKSLNTNKQFLHRTLAATLPDRRSKQAKSLLSKSKDDLRNTGSKHS